ncbi:MAG TPA: hypothetical protein VFL76_03395 [Edaphocola sp.]|nr:hypothetical protein [Edaphocola sp.]
MDPLAAQGGQDMLSPYQAMGDNPVSGTDPGGTIPPGGPVGFRNPNIVPFFSPAGGGIGSPTNGTYTPGINPANFLSIGQWITTFGGAAEGMEEAFGQSAGYDYSATVGNNSGTSSQTAGNYSNVGGSTGTGQGGGGGTIPTKVLPDGEVVAVNGSFNHEADADPSATFIGTTTVQSSYYTSVDVKAGQDIQLINSSLGDKLSLKLYTSFSFNKEGNFKTTYFNGKLESTSFHLAGPLWTTFDLKGNLLSTFSLFGVSISVPFSFSPSAGLTIDFNKPFQNTNLSNGLEINFRAGGYSILGMGMIAAPEVTIPIMSRVGTLRNVTPIFSY